MKESLRRTQVRELFERYGGDHGLMDHDGCLEAYEEFAISAATEVQWMRELQESLFTTFATELVANSSTLKFMRILRKTSDLSLLLEFLDVCRLQASRIDDFSKLLIVEGVLEFASLGRNDRRSLVLNALEALLDSMKAPFVFHSYHLAKPYLIDELKVPKISARVEQCRELLCRMSGS